MAAYVIFDIHVTDPAGYEGYKPLESAAVERYGGRYLVCGGRSQVLEGEWPVDRLVVLEFDSVEAARRFYDSPEYRAARSHRQAAADGRVVLVEGT